MDLDNPDFCYKEYPPIPEMMCAGHKERIRWGLYVPAIGMIIFAVVVVIIFLSLK